MQIVVKGKNMEVTPALRSYAEKKVGKLEKYFEQGEVTAQVMMRLERELHVVEVTLQVDALLLRGEERTADMYASIDGVLEKLERQIKKYKTRINRKLRQDVGTRPQEAKPPVSPEARDEEGEELGRVIRTKRFPIKPMSVEEAVMQMELLGHDFFVFRNSEDEEINVVYRRADGNYGLIEPD
ncbi:MAG TPA: ribosome-associated translation inhibitor RaiA [Firmicutes bacterium]|nr:ribosome-associated translation inhibitor RaiA [Bacillota bacterium]